MAAGELASWRAGMRAVVSCSDMASIIDAMVQAAMLGDTKAAALVLKYVAAPVPRAAQPTPIDATLLGTVEGCLMAYGDIMRELAAGNLDLESAAALRATVDGALRAHAHKTEETTANRPIRVVVQSHKPQLEEADSE